MSDEIDSVNDIQQSFFSIGEALDAEFVEEASMEEIDEQIKTEFASVIDDEDLKSKSNDLMANVQQEVADINTKKEEIETALTTARIKDSNFLEKEIKGLILSSKRVLETLEKDIKIGAPPRMYEVYATMVNAITGQYKELRSLNESIAKFVLENKKQNLDEVKEDHKMVLSSNDALDMYMKAKENSQLNAVDADFDLVDEDEIKREK